MNSDSSNDKKYEDELISIYSDLLNSELASISVQERFDIIANPPIPKLVKDKKEEEEFNRLIQEIIYAHGGVPLVVIKKTGEKNPIYDTFIDSLISEILSMYQKTRRSIIKVQSQYAVVESLRYNKQFFKTPAPEEVVLMFEEYFWDSLEIAYLRLASYWDRIGQLFSFSFFNIRKYDKETFTDIIEKINSNYVLTISELKSMPEYKELWDYSKLEDKNGLKWLLQRRNLIIHSVGINTKTNNLVKGELFDSKYNHLDEKISNKLKKSNLKDEISVINFHYIKMCEYFKNCLQLSIFACENCIKDRRK